MPRPERDPSGDDVLEPGPAVPTDALGWNATKVRGILAALRSIGGLRSPQARAERLLELVVEVASASGAALVSHAEGSEDVEQVVWSTPDPARLAHLRAATGLGGPQAALGGGGTDPTPGSTVRFPLRLDSGRRGTLHLVDVHPATADDGVLEEFLQLSALVVENGIRYQETRRQLAWREALADVSQLLLTPAAEDELQVWQRIVDHVHRLVPLRNVSISIPSEDDPELLEIRVAAGEGSEQLGGRPYARAGTVADLAMTARSSRRSTVHHADQVVHSLLEPHPVLGPLLAIPLVGQGEPRGVLVLTRDAHQPDYSPSDVTMVQEFADQATLALELAETRAAEVNLRIRTESDHLTETLQDRTIQRLYALSLTLDLVAQSHGADWLDQARAEVTAAITESREALRRAYGRDPG